MNLKKLPLLGAPVSLAYFFTTASAFAKDIDAATLAKMAESSAVRMSCGVADSSVIITGVNTASAGAGAASANTAGTTIIGVLISMALLLGVTLLSRRKGAKISPVVAWVAPASIVVPIAISPADTYSFIIEVLPYLGLGSVGPDFVISIATVSAFYLALKMFHFTYTNYDKFITYAKKAFTPEVLVPAEVGENEAKTVVDASVKTTAVRKAVCKQRIVREYRTKKLDVEAARSLLERAYSNGTAMQTKEDNDSACLTR